MNLNSIKLKVKLKVKQREQTRRTKKYSTFLNIPHDNLDKVLHIKKALNWLCLAQDAGVDKGVSWGLKIGEPFLPSYPETTGYIIPTFLQASEMFNDAVYLSRATMMGDWLIEVQMESGAIRGGVENDSPPNPAVFNTGQVVLGWCALYNATKQERFLTAAIKAADWLVNNASKDGAWRKGLSDFALKIVNVYNVDCAIGLLRLAEITSKSKYLDVAVNSAQFAIRNQNERGWFANCCLTEPQNPLLHTIAYTIRGILEIGISTGNEEFISKASLSANSILNKLDNHGFLPGRFNSDWNSSVDWSCLTGSAQMSIIWYKLFRITADEKYKNAAKRTTIYLMKHHDISSSDRTLCGGVTGSYPVHGEYGQSRLLNWAAKFFVDALVEAYYN